MSSVTSQIIIYNKMWWDYHTDGTGTVPQNLGVLDSGLKLNVSEKERWAAGCFSLGWTWWWWLAGYWFGDLHVLLATSTMDGCSERARDVIVPEQVHFTLLIKRFGLQQAHTNTTHIHYTDTFGQNIHDTVWAGNFISSLQSKKQKTSQPLSIYCM